MSAIPDVYLPKITTYDNINIHGAAMTVILDTGESSTVTNTKVSNFRSHVERNNVKVVGFDVKKKTVKTGKISNTYLLSLYASNRSLVIQLGSNNYYCANFPKPVYNFIKDNANVICFVGPAVLFERYFYGSCITYEGIFWNSLIVEAGDLAARVLKKPCLTKSTMDNIVREVGLVKYDGPPTGSGTEVEVDSRNLKVLSEEMVKNTINDAVANYLIGYKLLISTTTVKTEK